MRRTGGGRASDPYRFRFSERGRRVPRSRRNPTAAVRSTHVGRGNYGGPECRRSEAETGQTARQEEVNRARPGAIFRRQRREAATWRLCAAEHVAAPNRGRNNQSRARREAFGAEVSGQRRVISTPLAFAVSAYSAPKASLRARL